MSVLITGGAGYIGAHVVRLLRDRGDDVVVVDDLSGGDATRLGDTPLVEFDLVAVDAVDRLREVVERHAVTSIIHFAARKQVGESVAHPEWYFRDNIGSLANVVEASAAAGVTRLVYSSSAAVYGLPGGAAVTEDDATVPINPYGESKLVGEWLVRDAANAHGLRSVSLRYFNVAGAGWNDLGDPNVQNLVTIAIDRTARGLAPVVFGDSFDTPDGTGVRDYVHVMDLAEAHLAALDALATAEGPADAVVYNVGTGRGASVREVLAGLAAASGTDLEPIIDPPRPGDPPSVVADASRIAAELGWRSTRTLDDMVDSAWRAHEWRARTSA
ncbi:UDP-glucose 4-epimerase GalE [Agromyces sp. SYSU K20354]|uniref:UDP-glucose 4-epimerase GalE n=1 Tax=Agromyces cavernae TaxID=2898659 RepID=UPI001E4F7B24|nr:UDP-glucose 4-epimerase GalE [Agromyces cavernae]MCD2444076.1 UDP-glucose 4-epimerase GalE [Agromyces cavernae]